MNPAALMRSLAWWRPGTQRVWTTPSIRVGQRCCWASSSSDRPKSLAGNQPLSVTDPALFALIQQEHHRQKSGLELIASENFTSLSVLQCLGSVLTNKYAEGLPGARYYGGNDVVDEVERLCISRALQAYRLDPAVWGVNVQPYSGSPANFCAYTAILEPGGRLMGLDLPHGGHLTHGFYTEKRKVSASSIYFNSMPYRLNDQGVIDFDMLAKTAELFKPQLLVCGGSAYPRDWDYRRFREIADSVGAVLMMDMAHISGLVAAQEQNNPFEYCDFVTTTTHKSLRGPRSGMVFYRKVARSSGTTKPGTKTDWETRLNNAVFPANQGGPHVHQIAAMATQLLEVCQPEWRAYAQAVRANARALASTLADLGYTLSSGGTDNHLLLLNLRPLAITGSKAEKACDAASLTVNKNSIVGDKSAVTPGGIRLGTCALTTRGLTPADFATVGKFIHAAVQIALKLQATGGGPKMKLVDFEKECKASPELKALRAEVEKFALSFPFPGLPDPFA